MAVVEACFPGAKTIKGREYVVGIDEAGRGPVLGPMVYALFACPIEAEPLLRPMGIKDSKLLTAKEREVINSQLLELAEEHAWKGYIRAISAKEITISMLQEGVNLNELSYLTVYSLLDTFLLESGVKKTQVRGIFVDTVGPMEKYQARLQLKYPGIKFTVSKKADTLFPVVGAASILAKVTRDERLRCHPLPEGISRDYGSGYPGDAMTVQWLEKYANPVNGFPDIVRLSWKSAERILSNKGFHECIMKKAQAVKTEKNCSSKRTTAKAIKGLLHYAGWSVKK